MKAIKLLLVSMTVLFSQFVHAQDSYGQDFWIGVPGNFGGGGTIQLYVTAQSAASVTVTIPGLAFSTTVAVPANTLSTIGLPPGVQINSGGLLALGVHITATTDVTAYLMNQQAYTTDAHLALPVDALGMDYYLMTYTPGFAPTSITVVATQNNTTVNINPTVANSQSFTVGVSTAVVLNQGDVYTVRSNSSGGPSGDLTGSYITSDKPIAVFGASECAQVPNGTPYCDFLVEQMTPTTSWGKNFVTVPLGGRTSGDVFRIMAKSAGTAVNINGSLVATINAGQFFETTLASGTYNRINTSNPVLVGQFAKGSTSDGTISDPFFALVPPDDQFIVNYIISSGTPNVFNNYVNIISPNSNKSNVLVDGVMVGAGLWNAISGTTFSGAVVGPFTNGIHTVNSVLPIGVMAYGWGNDDSYGYLGGQSFSPVATVSQMSLNVTQTISIQAQQKCVLATVLDQNNNPVQNVLVNFTVQGGNTAAGFGNTNSSGQVTLCYNTCLAGTDTLIATIAGLSDTVYITVNPSSLGVVPTSLTGTAGLQQCVVATVLDGSNLPVQNAVVNFTITGTNAAATVSILTNALGKAQFCYIPALAGADVINVSAGCTGGNTATVNVTVQPSGGVCAINTALTTRGLNALYIAAGANNPSAYYYGLSAGKGYKLVVSGGTAPYTVSWSTTSGTILSWGNSGSTYSAGLYYPTANCWVKVTVTDANCTKKDSIWVPFVDYTCNPPGKLWYYQLCDTVNQTTVCIKGTGNMNTLLLTGNYVFGACTPKTDLVANAAGFVVYPNPTAGYVTIEHTFDVASKGTIDVLDINGRVLYTEKVDLNAGAFNYTVNLSHMPNGLYMVRLSSDREFYTERVQLIK